MAHTEIRPLRGTTAEWNANDIVPGDGELALEITTTGQYKAKLGDGIKTYSQLPYCYDFLAIKDQTVEATKQAGIATTKAIEATTQATIATTSAAEALSYKNSAATIAKDTVDTEVFKKKDANRIASSPTKSYRINNHRALDNTGEGLISNLVIKGNTTEIGTGEKSPDNPYKLLSIGEKLDSTGNVVKEEFIEVGTRGRNLFPSISAVDDFKKGIFVYKKSTAHLDLFFSNGDIIYKNTDNVYISVQIANLKPNTYYTISCKISKYEGTIYRLFGYANFKYEALKDGVLKRTYLTNIRGELPFGYPGETSFIYFLEGSITSNTQVVISDIQLVQSMDFNPYTPYQSSSIQLPLLSQAHLNGIEPLRCVGEISDEIDWDRGKIIRRVGQIVFDENVNWRYDLAYESPLCACFTYIGSSDGFGAINPRLGKSNIFVEGYTNVVSTTTNTESFTIGGSPPTYTNLYFKVLKSRLVGWSDAWTYTQKIDVFKAWISVNNLITLYQLATPIETDIPPEILNQYLMSYTNKTYISSTNYVQPTLQLDTLEEPISRKLFDDMVSKKLIESSVNSCVSESIDYEGNIKGVEGRTVKNEFKKSFNEPANQWVSKYFTILDDGYAKINDRGFNTLKLSTLKANTQYTILIETRKFMGANPSSTLYVLYNEEESHRPFINKSIPITVVGLKKVLVTTKTDLTGVNEVVLAIWKSDPFTPGDTAEIRISLIEGDWTNKEIGYFEGLNSIGQPSTLTLDNNGTKTELYDKEGNPIVLGAVGDIKDTWNSDGSITLRTKEMAITGRESWTYNATYHVFIVSGAIPYPITSQPASGFCDRYTVVSGGSITAIKEKECAWHVEGNFCVKDNATYTIETWVAYLKQQDALGTPLTIRYQLATPITIYPQTTNFPTYAGTNTVKVSGAVLPPSLAVEFPQSATQTEENIINKVVKLLPTAVVKEMVDSSYTEATNKINNI